MFPTLDFIMPDSNLSFICLGGFLLLLTVVFFYLANRKKTNFFINRNRMLEKEILNLNKELSAGNELLEEKLTQRTKVLLDQISTQNSMDLVRKIALKKAEESNFLKNTFFANMSFEMRAPLNAIIGFSKLLTNEVEAQEKPELVEFASVISKNGFHLLNLMENIIDLCRIDTNDYEIDIEEFEVNTAIHSCIAGNTEAANTKNLKLEFKQEEIYRIKGDRAAFEKSVNLILDNSIKYTSTGGITIGFEVDPKSSQLRIVLSDTGIGIDKSFLSTIFDSYRQKSSGYSSLQKGAGLGLPLAEKLILLMGGAIQIESERGIGTQVSLLFPMNENRLSKIDLGTAQAKKEVCIFLVEDDKLNRLLFEQILSGHSNLQIAIDGDDAFKKLGKAMDSEVKIDLFLLDINLPAPWDGLLLLKEFKKKWPLLNQVPFIAQTAYAMVGDKEKFLAAGFDDYISKPINKNELFTIIENNIRKFKALKKDAL